MRRLRSVLACLLSALLIGLFVNPVGAVPTRAMEQGSNAAYGNSVSSGEAGQGETTDKETADEDDSNEKPSDEKPSDEVTSDEKTSDDKTSDEEKSDEKASDAGEEQQTDNESDLTNNSITDDSEQKVYQGPQKVDVYHVWKSNVKETYDWSGRLPSDRGDTNYRIDNVEDKNGILTNYSVSDEGILSYHIRNKCLGSATVTVVASSQRYTDVELKLTIHVLTTGGGDQMDDETDAGDKIESGEEAEGTVSDNTGDQNEVEGTVSGNTGDRNEVEGTVSGNAGDQNEGEGTVSDNNGDRSEVEGTVSGNIGNQNEGEHATADNTGNKDSGVSASIQTPLMQTKPETVAVEEKPAIQVSLEEVLGAIRSTPEKRPEEKSTFPGEPVKRNPWGDVLELYEGSFEIDMSEQSVVPADVLQAIAGKNITLVLDMGDGIFWKINGQSFTQDIGQDIDFGLAVGGDAIPEKTVEEIAGENESFNLTLYHDGPFGFDAVLCLPMQQEKQGWFANLFYYDPATGELCFVDSGMISEDGSAELTFVHASEYTVVTAELPMGVRSKDTLDRVRSITIADSTQLRLAQEVGLQSIEAENPFWSLLIVVMVVSIAVLLFFAVSAERLSDK